MVKTNEIGCLGRDSAALGEIADPRFREIVSTKYQASWKKDIAEGRSAIAAVVKLNFAPNSPCFHT